MRTATRRHMLLLIGVLLSFPKLLMLLLLLSGFVLLPEGGNM